MIVRARRMEGSISEIVEHLTSHDLWCREYTRNVTAHCGQGSAQSRVINDHGQRRLDRIVCARR